jgi:small nuclear ribonucleoprotein (snRNP)-like protein
MEEPSEPSLETLERFRGQKVVVQTRDGQEFHGKLVEHDGYMNLLLEEVERYSKEKLVMKHKVVLIKGGNVSRIIQV